MQWGVADRGEPVFAAPTMREGIFFNLVSPSMKIGALILSTMMTDRQVKLFPCHNLNFCIPCLKVFIIDVILHDLSIVKVFYIVRGEIETNTSISFFKIFIRSFRILNFSLFGFTRKRRAIVRKKPL